MADDDRRSSSPEQPEGCVPATGPMQVVVSDDEHGERRLDVIDGTFEQVYRLRDYYSTTLFLAFSRNQGHLPYRRARQHESTICMRATLAEHEALWSRFVDLDKRLAMHLDEVTRGFVRAHVERKPR